MAARKYFVGSYATSPNLYSLEHPPQAMEPGREAAFYKGLAALDLCGGLEVQLHGDGTMHNCDEKTFLSVHAKPEWEAVLTCIGGTMGNIGACATFGLASTDEAGRQKAIEFAKVAQAAVGRWNGRAANCGKVVAVEIHSGPNVTKPGASSSAEAFAASLKELMAWDWQGAQLMVEHCDAPAAHPASKGFLTIENELDAIKAANAALPKATPVGAAINWARSTLETRDVATPCKHIQAVVDAKVPLGLMFSGCTPDPDSNYGPWKDCHMPHAPAEGVEFAVETSLMTAPLIKEASQLAAKGQLAFCGCKITSLASGYWVGSDDDDTPLRVGLNASLLQLIKAGQPDA